jgi:hypothetical protein
LRLTMLMSSCPLKRCPLAPRPQARGTLASRSLPRQQAMVKWAQLAQPLPLGLWALTSPWPRKRGPLAPRPRPQARGTLASRSLPRQQARATWAQLAQPLPVGLRTLTSPWPRKRGPLAPRPRQQARVTSPWPLKWVPLAPRPRPQARVTPQWPRKRLPLAPRPRPQARVTPTQARATTPRRVGPGWKSVSSKCHQGSSSTNAGSSAMRTSVCL